MSKKNIDVDLLASDANSLESAIKGIDSFVYHNFLNNEAKIEDISALSGLLTSVILLAKKHSDELADFSMEVTK